MTTLSTLAHQASTPPVPLGSRAVLRRIEAGCMDLCAHCDLQIKFAPKRLTYQVICNVYAESRWARVEHFHRDCYGAAGAPYGKPDSQGKDRRNTIRIKR